MSNLEIIDRMSKMLEQASCIIREQEALLLQHGILTDTGNLEKQRTALLEDIENTI